MAVKPIDSKMAFLSALRAYHESLKGDLFAYEDLAAKSETALEGLPGKLSEVPSVHSVLENLNKLLQNGSLGPVTFTMLQQTSQSPLFLELLGPESGLDDANTADVMINDLIFKVADDYSLIGKAMRKLGTDTSSLLFVWNTIYGKKNVAKAIESAKEKFRSDKPYALPAEIEGKMPAILKASKPLNEQLIACADLLEILAAAIEQALVTELDRILPEAVDSLQLLASSVEALEVGMHTLLSYPGAIERASADYHSLPLDAKPN